MNAACQFFATQTLVTLVLLANPAVAQPTGASLVLENAQIVDPLSRTIRYGSITVIDGRIVDPPPSGSGQPAARIDLEGRWLVPAFADLHVHAYGNASPAGIPEIMGIDGVARRMLAAGVAAFLDLANFEELILDLRDEQRERGVEGASIYAAGTSFTCPGGHGTEYPNPARVVEGPKDAERSIAQLLARQPDVVKVIYDPSSPAFPSMSRETLATLTAAANRHGVPVVAHIGSWADAMDAVLEGVAAITHVDSEPVPQALIDAMLERRVAAIPTLVVQTELARLVAEPKALTDPLLRSLAHPELLAAYQESAAVEQRFTRWLAVQRASRSGYLSAAASFAEAGVTVLVGTDSGNLGTFQGYSVHREMALLVEAGLSPWQALSAATVDAGRFLGRPVGLRPGDWGDFVVLDASPIDDITNTTRIHAVVRQGRWIAAAATGETP